MSNSLAIATVTAALRNLIQKGLDNDALPVPGSGVTTQPPDEVKTASNLINLFLYQTMIDGAWRNMDIPRRVKPGETGQPPLALNLFYLLTAYAKDNDLTSPVSHRLLGRAMRVLHDHPVLSSAEIKAALPDNDLFDQIEHVRITPQPINLDEMSKLWTTFQSKYRISVAYQVAVVLIESQRPLKTPLPVLTRGEKDEGIDAQADLLPPYPTLTEISLPTKTQPGAQLGDTIVLSGHHLDGDSMIARFSGSHLPAPILSKPLPVVAGSDAAKVEIKLPDAAVDPTKWLSGYLTVALVITRTVNLKTTVKTTNELSFALLPRITNLNPTNRKVADGNFTLTVKCDPPVTPEQRVSLLFAGNDIAANAHVAMTDTLTFPIEPVTDELIGENPVRLRVNGVDSMAVDYTKKPPEFLANQKVNITT